MALKSEVDKLNLAKLVNVSITLNNLKTKVDALDVGKWKPVLEDLKKLSDIEDKQADVENKKFNTLKAKINKIYKNVCNITTSIHIN